MATTSGTMPMPASGSVEFVTELLWQHAISHLQKTNNEILLPIDIRSIVGGASIEVIKTRLEKLLNTPVVAFEDSVNRVYRIMPTPAFDCQIGAAVLPMSLAANNRSIATQPLNGNELVSQDIICQVKAPKVPRPPNAFILYRQHHHPVIKAAHPEYHNNDICELATKYNLIYSLLTLQAVLLGKKWKAESSETKAHFKALAEEIKKKHAEENPGYQYVPRKPSEKKRRCTNRRNGPAPTQKHAGGEGIEVSLHLSQNGISGLIQSDAEGSGLSPESTESAPATQREQLPPSPPVTTSSAFHDALANQSDQFVMGIQGGEFLSYGRRRHSPTNSMSTVNQLAPIPPLPQQLPQQLNAPQPPAEDSTQNDWTTDVDFDFDEYFLDDAQ
ncbi:mating type protein MAT1-2-1 [Trichophyton verrucosum HKI 0517]|uniref:Mating type protein MAT1-2-1 n=1 Tax=Trichophyton verrucosum (strain HKI 0517) TaxID=663202 RepID=D4D4N5_TRIVH|nr:mating type protein MAT1-2-1 [Trichophyton verrucosum HKI 0517]EFE43237.1 mating type protein MAT1-2-1 [Trichophyton verrucosum HKI 0517]